MTQRRSSTARDDLVRAAERLVAEKGVHGARASEVVKAAGQRNNSAVAYHFGSWENLLVAVWESHIVVINEERTAFLARARDKGVIDLAALVQAYIEPLVADIARHSPSYWARFSEQWMASVPMEFFAIDSEPGGTYPTSGSILVLHNLFTEIAESLEHLPVDQRTRRVGLMSRHVIAALAAWERDPAPAQTLESLQDELVNTSVAMLEAPGVGR
ncbi:TetR/AcrR family transcriptional regulator [Gordonia sp. CPCC 205515]|uniref:TetR/AcrR family transcriptional regulator n=1 Tax=Gordonia sp. CPCC 205515 TaxID=3140791 RepID=UPI003AF3666D